ncbi:MAG: LEA type 2 family protein [Bacteroidota bacterium]
MNFKYLFLVFGLFFLSSCIEYDDVNVISIGKISLDSIDGNTALVNVDVELENPNFFGIKVKPSTLDVFIEDEYVGKAILQEKVKIKKKMTGLYNAKIQLVGESGLMRKAVKYALKKELKIRITGNVKGSVYGFPKKVFVDKTKTVDGRKFKLF